MTEQRDWRKQRTSTAIIGGDESTITTGLVIHPTGLGVAVMRLGDGSVARFETIEQCAQLIANLSHTLEDWAAHEHKGLR